MLVCTFFEEAFFVEDGDCVEEEEDGFEKSSNHLIIIVNVVKYQMNANRAPRHNPADYIKQLLGRPVEVKLNDNYSFFQGTLTCLDGTMNVLLSQVREIS